MPLFVRIRTSYKDGQRLIQAAASSFDQGQGSGASSVVFGGQESSRSQEEMSNDPAVQITTASLTEEEGTDRRKEGMTRGRADTQKDRQTGRQAYRYKGWMNGYEDRARRYTGKSKQTARVRDRDNHRRYAGKLTETGGV